MDTLAAKVSGKAAKVSGSGRKVSGKALEVSERPPKCPGEVSPYWGERFLCPIGGPPEWGRSPECSNGRRSARTGALPASLAFLPATPGAGKPVPPVERPEREPALAREEDI